MAVDNISHANVKYKPIILLILDGWGLSPSWGGNAISMNNPPEMNLLWRDYPHAILQAFQKVAGPTGKVGSSEIGHASIGTGRIVQQDLTEISQAIKSGQFYDNSVLKEACQYVNQHHSTMHLIGLLSDGGIHSHLDHLFALLNLAKKQQVKNVAIHAIIDGRDVDKESALIYLYRLDKEMKKLGLGKIATLGGRFYAMDRDNNLERTALAYQAQVFGKGKIAANAKEAVKDAYRQKIPDEYLPNYVIRENNQPVAKIKDQDAVIFFNIRADRSQQLSRFYTDKNFLKKLIFWRQYKMLDIFFVSLTDYHLSDLPIHIAFKPAEIDSSIGAILSDHGFKQLRVAESEKKAHVSYFFNGGKEEPYPRENRIIIPSPKVASYSQKPEMSAEAITKVIVQAIKNKKYDFVVANYANVDMLGHTGDIEAAAKAIKTVDKAVKKIVEIALQSQAAVIITADHGNAEQMNHLNYGDTETMHTLNPVPFVLVTPYNRKNLLKSALTSTKGILVEIMRTPYTLADISPTILQLFDITKPTEMTGNSLLDKLK